MKTILFATDFSRASRQAALTAAHIAFTAKAKLVILNAFRYEGAYDSEINILVFGKYEFRDGSQAALRRLKKRLLNKVSPDLEIEIKAKQGFAEDVILHTVDEMKADLLVMGAVGNTPLSSRLFGSIATSVMKNSPVPVLLNPPFSKFIPFENIILGLDLSKKIDSVTIGKLLQFTKYFPSVINILVISKTYDQSEQEKLKEEGKFIRELLINQPHTFSIVTAEDVVPAILGFAKKGKADLIVSLPLHHNFFEKLLTQSNTERLALESEVPVLAIH